MSAETANTFQLDGGWRIETWWEVIADLPHEYRVTAFFREEKEAYYFFAERDHEGAECSLGSVFVLTNDGQCGWVIDLNNGIRVHADDGVRLPPPDIVVAVRGNV